MTTRKAWQVSPEKRDAVLALIATGPQSTSEIARSIWPGAQSGAAAQVCKKLAQDGWIRRLPFPDMRWVGKDASAVRTPAPAVTPSSRRRRIDQPPSTSWWIGISREAWSGAVAARYAERSHADEPRPLDG